MENQHDDRRERQIRTMPESLPSQPSSVFSSVAQHRQRHGKRNRRDGGKRDLRDMMSLSSFSDIAFLLIIFFILATTLVQVSGVINKIPSGEQSQSEQDPESPTVQLDGGLIKFNDKQVDMPTLRQKLAELKLREKTEDERVILLEASGNVTYQNYFDAMASISAAGGVTAILQEEEE